MAVFMEESGVDVRKGHSQKRGSLRSHFNTITFGQGPFPDHQFSGHQIPNFLTERQTLTSDCKVYSAGTVTDNFIRGGGDAAMR